MNDEVSDPDVLHSSFILLPLPAVRPATGTTLTERKLSL
jgi:hypothetical protein